MVNKNSLFRHTQIDYIPTDIAALFFYTHKNTIFYFLLVKINICHFGELYLTESVYNRVLLNKNRLKWA